MINWTEVLLSLMTLLGSCGWFVAGNSEFVNKFRELIIGPLETEVKKLRSEVKDLKEAIEAVYDCPYRTECPVKDKLNQKRSTR